MTPYAAAATHADGATRLAQAESLLELVHTDVKLARDRALTLLEPGLEDEADAVALRVVGLSLRFSDPQRSSEQLRRAVSLAHRLRLPVRAAQARTTHVVVLSQLGRTRAALREAELAEAGLQAAVDELELARLRVNHALVLQRIGRQAEALVRFGAAEPVLRRYGDVRWEVMLRNLRGTLLAYQGRSDLALADLTTGIELAGSVELKTVLCSLHQNLGFALLRAGRVPEALKQIANARSLAASIGRRQDSSYADRADALLAAGLPVEALEDAERALAGQLEAGLAFDAAESRLIGARAALAAGERPQAAEFAATARQEFTRQRRYTWATQAWQVELAARFAGGERTAELLRDLTQCVVRLERAGWLVTPQQARLQAARTAAALGRRTQADRLYAQIAAERFSGLSNVRLLAWEAEYERLLLLGDRPGAGRAITRGLSVLAQYANTLGSTDLRAGAASLGTGLATAGLRLSLEGGSARSLLIRTEQWRAASLRRAPAHPPQSGRLAELLNLLRAVTNQVTDEGLDGKDIRPLQRERGRLEHEIKDLARHAPGTHEAPESPLDLRKLGDKLGGRALVEYVRLDDELHAIVLADGRCTRTRIGSYQAVLAELDQLRFAMGRIAAKHGSPALLRGAMDVYDHARTRLDQVLLGDLGRQISGHELVLVPTGSLHALAWAALPSLENRVLTVAPSARSWLAADQVPELSGHVALAHGPGLDHAEAEITTLAGLYPEANALRGDHATAPAVAESWDGARLAHLAAHGRFRRDNPLFSNLELADGPLTVYDLESLRRAPRVLILSACDAALSGIKPGDELMGVASALLTQGCKTIIASVAPVADEHTRTLMLDVHAALARGLRPAQALADAQAAQAKAGAPAFICLGAG
ncbi:CHAT domain-containing protein [Actinospica robiniae]|uniref:CHAT domain-containing protein n=1 Tax=Actinospica robiniae TaxID=304901 RepID=UPI000424D8D0|nr:CHAT domain-containing protein [Actinospica robiniae]